MYQAVRGTQDILPADRAYWRYVTEQMHAVAALYGLQQIDTPIFEETSLFVRGVGEGTDIVDKEMYSFQDKGGDEITLRPEFTAGVMRAYIEHGMHVLPAAGQALFHRPDLPLRAPAGRPLPPVPPVQHRNAGRDGSGRGFRGHVRGVDAVDASGLPRPELPAQLHGVSTVPAGLSGGAGGLLPARTKTA